MEFKKVIATVVASSVMLTSVVSFAKNVSALQLSAKFIDVSIELKGLTDENLKHVPLKLILDNMTYASDVYADDEPEQSGSDTSELVDPDNSEPTDPDNSEPVDPDKSEPTDPDKSEPTDPDNSEPVDPDKSEPTDPDNSEPVDPDKSEPTDPDNSEPVDPDKSEPADPNTNEPADSDNGETENVDVQFQTGEAPIIDVSAGELTDSGDTRKPIRRKGEKVELNPAAEYVRIDNVLYSLADENATVNLFDETQPDEYNLVKEIIIGSEDPEDSDNDFFTAYISITRNRWSFDGFRFYTQNENDEKTYLKTKPGKEADNSCTFAVFSPLERGKNIYLEADDLELTQYGIPRGDVDIEITYNGTNVKADNILTDGKITLDLRAFDKEDDHLITEQLGFTAVIAEEEFTLSARITADSEAEASSTFPFKSDLPDTAETNISFTIGSNDSEFALALDKLGLMFSDVELGEDDILKAVLGRYDALDNLDEEAADIRSDLFGSGVTAVDGTELTLFVDPASVPDFVTDEALAFVIHINVNIEVTEPEPSEPDNSEPTTSEPDNSEPTTSEPDNSEPTTSEPDNSEPTTSEPDNSEPTTSEPNNSEPTTSEPDNSEPTTSEPTNSEPDPFEPDNSEPTNSEPDPFEPDNSEPTNSEPDPSEPDNSEPDNSEPDTSEPDTSEPNDTEPDPFETEPDPEIEPAPEIKFYSNIGDSRRIYFSCLTDDYCEILFAYSGGELDDLMIDLIDADNIALGDTEIIIGEAAAELLSAFEPIDETEYLGVVRIRLNAVKDGYGRLFNGNISGVLTVSAAYAEPVSITLSGNVEVLRITERVAGDSAVKLIPYSTEFKLNGDVEYDRAKFSASGLPSGLSIDAQTGIISGIPETSGEFIVTITADISTTDENGNIRSAEISREITLSISANTAKNLHMVTDPNYAIETPLGDSFDGRAYYLNGNDLAQPLEVTLKGDCSEFVDVWLNGVKLRRLSDDYKTMHGSTLITFSENTLSDYEADRLNTIVFGFKSAETEKMIYAAQNFIIVDDKSTITPNEQAIEEYKDVYTPSNMLDEELAPEFADALASVRVYADHNTFAFGDKLIVKPYSTDSEFPAMIIKMVDKNGAPIETDAALTARISLPESYLSKAVYLYEITNGRYTSIGYIDVKDGRLFFSLDPSKSYAISEDLLNELGEPIDFSDGEVSSSGVIVSGAKAVRQLSSDGNPVTGIAASGVGIVTSGVALALIFLTGKRKKK